MHDMLRRRLLRKIESLPEEQIYQVLDYIEFLEAKYGESSVEEDTTGLQRFAERLEDGLRRRTVRPGRLREAFQLIAAADRVLSDVTSAGRDLLGQLEEEDAGPSGRAGSRETAADSPGGRRTGEPTDEPGSSDGARGTSEA